MQLRFQLHRTGNKVLVSWYTLIYSDMHLSNV